MFAAAFGWAGCGTGGTPGGVDAATPTTDSGGSTLGDSGGGPSDATVPLDSNTSPGTTVRITNRSRFAISELHVAAVGSQAFGPNLLVGLPYDNLYPNDVTTIGLACGLYDAHLLGELATDDCVLSSQDLCDLWDITNAMLEGAPCGWL